MSNRLALVALLPATLLLITLCACGSTRMPGWDIGHGPNPPPPEIYEIKPYLAPGQAAGLPTTIRVQFSLRDTLLPIRNVSFDHDGEGSAVAAVVDVRAIDDNNVPAIYVAYYFDYAWNGPDGARASVSIDTARGLIGGHVYLYLAQLQPWPH